MQLNFYFTFKKQFSNLILLERSISLKGILKNFLDATLIIKELAYNLIDHTNVDLKTKDMLVYIFTFRNQQLILFLETLNSSVESIQNLLKFACTSEREIFEFFGIFFQNAKDLRRLLTDYSLKGHPLKKNFPLMGFIEYFYSVSKNIQSRPLILMQAFRLY